MRNFLCFPEFLYEAEFTLTRSGNSKLMWNGYEYVKNKMHGDVTHWRCVRSRWSQCKGKGQTKLINGKHMLKVYGSHNHLPFNNMDVFSMLETIEL